MGWPGQRRRSAFLSLQSAAYWLGVYDEIKDTCNATKPYESGENDPADNNVDALSLALNLEVDLGFATLSSISSYRDLEDFNASWGWASDNVGTASYLEVLGVDDNKAEQWSQELRLSGVAFDDAVDWTVGGYLFEEDALNNLDVPLFRGVQLPDCASSPISCFPFPLIPGTPLAPLAGVPFGIVAQQLFQIGGSRFQIFDATNSSEALFGEITWRFMDRFALTAGVRHTWDKREFTRTETLPSAFPTQP